MNNVRMTSEEYRQIIASLKKKFIEGMESLILLENATVSKNDEIPNGD